MDYRAVHKRMKPVKLHHLIHKKRQEQDQNLRKAGMNVNAPIDLAAENGSGSR
jgi:hypothetical protein